MVLISFCNHQQIAPFNYSSHLNDCLLFVLFSCDIKQVYWFTHLSLLSLIQRCNLCKILHLTFSLFSSFQRNKNSWLYTMSILCCIFGYVPLTIVTFQYFKPVFGGQVRLFKAIQRCCCPCMCGQVCIREDR